MKRLNRIASGDHEKELLAKYLRVDDTNIEKINNYVYSYGDKKYAVLIAEGIDDFCEAIMNFIQDNTIYKLKEYDVYYDFINEWIDDGELSDEEVEEIKECEDDDEFLDLVGITDIARYIYEADWNRHREFLREALEQFLFEKTNEHYNVDKIKYYDCHAICEVD